MVHLSSPDIPLPPPQKAGRDGLLAIGGELTVERLLEAYRNGIFPWNVPCDLKALPQKIIVSLRSGYAPWKGVPVTWWSPNPRAIFDIASVQTPRTIAALTRNGKFHVTFNTAFELVIRGCAAVSAKRDSTWISSQFIEGYLAFHQAGYAQSVEVWQGNQLVGGGYGVAIGGFYAGESLFHTVSNASKIAFYSMNERLKERGFVLCDSQILNAFTAQLGAFEVSRDDYLRLLASALAVQASFR